MTGVKRVNLTTNAEAKQLSRICETFRAGLETVVDSSTTCRYKEDISKIYKGFKKNVVQKNLSMNIYYPAIFDIAATIDKSNI